jgi:2-polyprenyl-6-methoxyphenol hydroxylase-like FAD-dependent oxidoreductase
MSVIIVGGGMTGATLALAISRLTGGKLPVHLIEAVAPQGNDHPGFDARAIAIAQGTSQQLARFKLTFRQERDSLLVRLRFNRVRLYRLCKRG